GGAALSRPPARHDEMWEVQTPPNSPRGAYGFGRSTPDLMRRVTRRLSEGARSPCRRRSHRWLRCWGLWRLRGRRFISALGAAEIPHISCEVSEDRMIRKDKVLSNVAVGNDQSIHADRFEQALRARASGGPANEHDVPVGRVLDGLGAEIGNEVEQIDDALGILLRPADRTRGVRPISGDVRHGNRRHPGQHARLVWVHPGLPPVLDPVRTPLLLRLAIGP